MNPGSIFTEAHSLLSPPPIQMVACDLYGVGEGEQSPRSEPDSMISQHLQRAAHPGRNVDERAGTVVICRGLPSPKPTPDAGVCGLEPLRPGLQNRRPSP